MGKLIQEIIKGLGTLLRRPAPLPVPPRLPPGPAPLPPRPPMRPAPPRPNPRPNPQQPNPQPQPQPRPPRVPDVGEGPQTAPEPAPQTEPNPETDGRTETEGATDTDEDQNCKDCPECIARDMGIAVDSFYGAVTPGSQRGYDYQHFICPWHAHNRAGQTIEEWMFSGRRFDGLHPSECLLIETKHGYDNFLRTTDWSASGRPEPLPYAIGVFDTIVTQAMGQHAVVFPHWPDVQLKWVFSSMETKLYVYQRILDNGLAIIIPEVRPFV